MPSNNYIDQYTKVFLSCYTGSLYDECGNSWTSTGTLSIGYAIPSAGSAADKTFPTAIYFGKGTAALASAIDTTNKDVTIDFWYYRGDGHNSSQTKKLISFNEGRYFEFTGSPKTHNVWVNACRETYLYIEYWTWYHIAYVFSKSANVWYIFLNGKKYDTLINQCYVKSIQPVINKSNVYIKNLRVSVGIARWTSDFVPNNKMYLPPPVKANKIFALARYLSGPITAIFNIYRIPGFENINEYNTKRTIYKNYKNDTKRIVLVAPKVPFKYDLKRKIVMGGIDVSSPNGLPLFNNDTKRKFLLGNTSGEPLLKNHTKRKIINSKNSSLPLQNDTKRKIINSKNSSLPLQNDTKRKVVNSNIGNEPLLKNHTKRKIINSKNSNLPLQNDTKRKVVNSNIGKKPLQTDTKRIILFGNNKKVPLLKNDTQRLLSSYMPLIKYNLRRIISNNINIIVYTIKIEKITIELKIETERNVKSYKKIPWSFIFNPNYQLKKKGT